ncbi:hypothetical protein Alches_17280 [Alicyclobacillus hesperidum subsp. aegles]|uniref:LrgB family protein n=1 Tax=Alicyclobacillus hesperidum TaxID=89784 RepID=UPI000726A91C|nr:LrgB family protein [Alicyclobacillus hesperidum]KRW90795.1 LrgB [Alicyclobacillus tengchongensis]GLG01688.1 hypothetical protein Alches_17280 [Alicyclobacillus hesperidum subsp. aegles]
MVMWLGLVSTLICYGICKKLYQRFHYVFLNPVLTCLAVLIAFLSLAHVSYHTYFASGKWLTDMLSPATVALAIPLYRNVHILKAHWLEFLVSLVSGAAAAIVSSILLARLMRLGGMIETSVAPRSVTTPIAMDISQTIGGIPTLTAVFVIITGISGVVIGPLVIRYVRIRSAIAKGAIFGMGCHGIGTARAFEMGQMEGTCSSLSMVIAAFITLALAPSLVPLLT